MVFNRLVTIPSRKLSHKTEKRGSVYTFLALCCDDEVQLLNILPNELVRLILLILGVVSPNDRDELRLFSSVYFGKTWITKGNNLQGRKGAGETVCKTPSVYNMFEQTAILDLPEFCPGPSEDYPSKILMFETFGEYKSIACVEYILRNRDIRPTFNVGHNVLKCGSLELFKLFINLKTIDVNSRDRFLARDPYKYVDLYSSEYREIILYIRDRKGVQENKTICTSAFKRLAQFGRLDHMIFLRDMGFVSNGKEIISAIKHGQLECVKWIMDQEDYGDGDYHQDPDSEDYMHPMEAAAYYNSHEILEWLLDEGYTTFRDCEDDDAHPFTDLCVKNTESIRMIAQYWPGIKRPDYLYHGDIIRRQTVAKIHHSTDSDRIAYWNMLWENGFRFTDARGKDEKKDAKKYKDKLFLKWRREKLPRRGKKGRR